MTDYEVGLLVGAFVTWPVTSIASVLFIGFFVGRR